MKIDVGKLKISIKVNKKEDNDCGESTLFNGNTDKKI
jgi:hypothetical protein